MNKYILIIFIGVSIHSYAQTCKKQIAKNEYDPIKKNKTIETKVNAIYQGWNTAYSVRFLLDGGKIFAKFTSTEDSKIGYNDEVGFLFEKDSSILSKFRYSPTSKLIANTWYYFNEIELTVEEFRKFTNLRLIKIHWYGANTKVEISDGHSAGIMESAKCFAENVDFTKDILIPVKEIIKVDSIQQNKNTVSISLKSDTTAATEVIVNKQITEQGCANIERKIDKFTGEVSLSSPIFRSVSFQKTILNGDTLYSVYLIAPAPTYTIGKGVIILLKSGKKIEYPNTKVSVSGREASAMIMITKREMKLLSMDSMTDFRLYIYDRTISEESGVEFRNYANCLLKSK